MTEYQKIENELLSLDWKKEQGSGDHIHFTKEGNPHKIIVSQNVSAEGRALKNSYAQIRRVEPRFSLGRQTHMIRTADTQDRQGEQPPSDTVPEGIPEWMSPGCPVRFTSPEKRDWPKLLREDAVMGAKYIVRGYRQTDDGTLVYIAPEKASGGTDADGFAVFPDDLDMWDVHQCMMCGKTLPDNWLYQDEQNNYLCEECFDVLSEKKPEPEPKADVRKTPAQKMAESDPVMKQLLEVLKTMEAVRPEDIPPAERERILEQTEKAFKMLSAKAKKALQLEFPAIIGALVMPARTQKPTNYTVWKQTLEELISAYLFRNRSASEDEMRRRFYATRFDVKALKDRKTRRKNVAWIVNISADDPEVALEVYNSADLFVKGFGQILSDLPVGLLITNPSMGIRTYALDFTRNDYDRQLEILEQNLPDSERAFLARAKANNLLPSLFDVRGEIDRRGIAAGYGEPDFSKFDEIIGVRTSELERFDAARPCYIITVEDSETDPEKFERLREQLADNPIKAPLYLKFIHKASGREMVFDYVDHYVFPDGAYAPEPAEETGGKQDGGRLLLKIVWPEGADNPTFYGDKDTENWKELLAASLCASAEESPTFREVYAHAIAKFRDRAAREPVLAKKFLELVGNKNTLTKNNDTMEQNFLDNTNPSSANPTAGTLTTRELIRELRSRGVEFENLTITIRKTIDVNEL